MSLARIRNARGGRTYELWTGKTAVFVGDSITYGVGASTGANKWTTKLCAARGATEDNNGIPGAGVTPAIGSLGCGRGVVSNSDVPTYTSGHKYLFLAPGVNDIGTNVASMTVAAYKSAYQDLITHAKGTKVWAASDIVLITPFYFTGYNLYTIAPDCGVVVAADVARHEAFVQAVIELAIANHTCLINVYAAMRDSDNPPALLDDTIHPNDAGHEFIFTYIDKSNFRAL